MDRQTEPRPPPLLSVNYSWDGSQSLILAFISSLARYFSEHIRCSSAKLHCLAFTPRRGGKAK